MTQASIISLANAMYAPPSPSSAAAMDDRLDAARALLFGGAGASKAASPSGRQQRDHQKDHQHQDQDDVSSKRGRSRSDSAGLDALALICASDEIQEGVASTATASAEPPAAVVVPPLAFSTGTTHRVSASSSDSDDSETMPPPPPRVMTTTRRRSVSNPEGMERWAPRVGGGSSRSRFHLVLPASILEEELAEANAAMKAIKERDSGEIEDREESDEEGDSEEDEDPQDDDDDNDDEEEEEEKEAEEEEEYIDEKELLRRARSRLLEDLSQVSLNGEKGLLALPHSLEKYKEVYNKNGRIGIYTPAERAAIIRRFQDKRTRRVWNKKIRYNCRKNLADRRMRVKGRFVKRTTEQTKTATIPEGGEAGPDAEMPDVNDPDAGFCPTDEQPFRRLRRHTIT